MRETEAQAERRRNEIDELESRLISLDATTAAAQARLATLRMQESNR